VDIFVIDHYALPELPFPRSGILDIAPKTRELLQACPVARVRTMVGDEAWLVTGYDHAKALFNDHRLGRSHPNPEAAARISNFVLLSGPVGDFATEQVEHRRMRALLTPAFSARRVRALRGRVERLVEAMLDDVAALGPPVDLHEVFSYPLPVRVICELLGVPFADRALFQTWADGLHNLGDAAASAAAYENFREYMVGAIEEKRRRPGDDLISDLIAAQRAADLTDDKIAGFAAILLVAGHGTTVAYLDFGVLFLLLHPDQRAALAENPGRAPAAVEELLRIVPLGSKFNQLRYAREDIVVGETTIQAGDAVLLAGNGANRDPSVFPDPDRLDLHRPDNQHLSFGYGPRHCLGANLARLELEIAFTGLLRRFPTLRLAEPLANLEIADDQLLEVLVRLPVAW
jgi:pentalenolactone synthase